MCCYAPGDETRKARHAPATTGFSDAGSLKSPLTTVTWGRAAKALTAGASGLRTIARMATWPDSDSCMHGVETMPRYAMSHVLGELT